MTLTTTPVGRLLVEHPDFNFDPGTGLHDALRTLYTKLSDNIGCRYFTETINNSSSATFLHNYNTDIANLRTYLYEIDGSGNLVPIVSGGSPDLDDFTIAASPPNDEFIGITVQNNTGSSITIAALIYQAPLVEKLSDLQDVNFPSPAANGQVLQYDGTNFIPSYGLNPVGSIVAYNPGYYSNSANSGFSLVGPSTNNAAGVNNFLNAQGYYVCDGAAVNVAGSPIWNAGGRHVPNLSNDRFLQGSSSCGSQGGSNSSAHTHQYTHTHAYAHTHLYNHTHGTNNQLGTITLAHSHTVNNHTHNITAHSHGSGTLYTRIDKTGTTIYTNQTNVAAWSASEGFNVNSDFSSGSTRSRGMRVSGNTSNNGNVSTGGSSPGTNSRLSNYNASHSHSTNSQSANVTTDQNTSTTTGQSTDITTNQSNTNNRPQYLTTYYIIRVV